MDSAASRCADCGHVFEIGDRYIEDAASGFIKAEADPEIDGIIADLFGGGSSGKLRFCEDCTEPGGDYRFETFYDEEAEASG